MMAATGNGDTSLAAATDSSSATEGAGKIVERHDPVHSSQSEEKPKTESAVQATDDCSVVSPENNESVREGEDLNDDPPKTFPQKLMEMLSDENTKDAITWLPHGKAFIIYRKKSFSEEVLPKYFKACKYTSFTRKLNRWGFTRVTRGPEMGSYFHPKFVRDDPKLCLQMCSNSGVNPVKFAPLLFPGGQATAQQMIPMISGAIPSMGMMGFFPGMMPFGIPSTVASSTDPSTAMIMQQQMAMFQQMQQFQIQQFQFQQQMQQQKPTSAVASSTATTSGPAPSPPSAAASAPNETNGTKTLTGMSSMILPSSTQAPANSNTISGAHAPASTTSTTIDGMSVWQQSQHQAAAPTPVPLQIQESHSQPSAPAPAPHHDTTQHRLQFDQSQLQPLHPDQHRLQQHDHSHSSHASQHHHRHQQQHHSHHHSQDHARHQHHMQQQHHHPLIATHHNQQPRHHPQQHHHHQQHQPQQHHVHITQDHGSYVNQQTSPQTLQTF